MAGGPTFSVVIPCYNGTAFVGETIRGALAQTRPPLEVIVVDDGSTDDSAAVAAACGPAVKVIRQPNGGAAAARNAGVRAAAGDWIAFLDADDAWAADRLEKVGRAAAAAGPDVVAVFNDLEYVHPDGSRTPRPTPTHLLAGDWHVNLICDWLVNPSAFAVRAAVAREVPFPEGVRNVEDQQFVLLLRQRGPFAHLPEPLTGYRRWPGQITADPGHVLLATTQNLKFVSGRPDLYPPAAAARVRARMGDALVDLHAAAYWRREYDVVRECRRLYFEVHPNPAPDPPLFRARLYPRWLARLKDAADRVIARARGAAAGG